MTYNKKVKPYHIWIKKRNNQDDLIIDAMELPIDTIEPDPFVRRSELREMISEIKDYIDSKVVNELKMYVDKILDEKLEQKFNEKLANVATKDDIVAINQRLDGHDQLFKDHGWL